eukprot:TRINITY_DN951_c0_g1_i1.p1 TRINITY_DN951_c0_g1~~TRINITY_DN951_c0_g1_i1.p1  ORF type:complete len:600 (+),score=122.07 TRINITY_DN951_c0_g1_i1:80-1879(+)
MDERLKERIFHEYLHSNSFCVIGEFDQIDGCVVRHLNSTNSKNVYNDNDVIDREKLFEYFAKTVVSLLSIDQLSSSVGYNPDYEQLRYLNSSEFVLFSRFVLLPDIDARGFSRSTLFCYFKPSNSCFSSSVHRYINDVPSLAKSLIRSMCIVSKVGCSIGFIHQAKNRISYLNNQMEVEKDKKASRYFEYLQLKNKLTYLLKECEVLVLDFIKVLELDDITVVPPSLRCQPEDIVVLKNILSNNSSFSNLKTKIEEVINLDCMIIPTPLIQMTNKVAVLLPLFDNQQQQNHLLKSTLGSRVIGTLLPLPFPEIVYEMSNHLSSIHPALDASSLTYLSQILPLDIELWSKLLGNIGPECMYYNRIYCLLEKPSIIVEKFLRYFCILASNNHFANLIKLSLVGIKFTFSTDVKELVTVSEILISMFNKILNSNSNLFENASSSNNNAKLNKNKQHQHNNFIMLKKDFIQINLNYQITYKYDFNHTELSIPEQRFNASIQEWKKCFYNRDLEHINKSKIVFWTFFELVSYFKTQRYNYDVAKIDVMSVLSTIRYNNHLSDSNNKFKSLNFNSNKSSRRSSVRISLNSNNSCTDKNKEPMNNE